MKLAEARARAFLSIRKLAILADVAPSVIYYTEAGKRTPALATMVKIGSALGLDPMDIDEFRDAIEGKSVA